MPVPIPTVFDVPSFQQLLGWAAYLTAALGLIGFGSAQVFRGWSSHSASAR